MEPSLTARVTPSTEVLFQEIGGESVLLDLASESYFGLDDVGTRIWELLQVQGDLGAVFDQILGEYEVEPTRLEQDLLAHIGELVAAGLVTVSDGPTPAP